MSTNKKAWVVGTDKIMAWYETASDRTGCSLFSIMCGKDLIASWTDPDDPEQAAEVLRMSLTAAEENGNSDMLTLRIHKGTDADGYITARTPAIQSIYVRACPVDQSGRLAYNSTQGGILEELRLMRQEILELKMAQEEEEDEPGGVLGMLNGIVKDPMVKQGLMGWILGALRGAGQPAPGPMSLAGPNEQPTAQQPAAPAGDQNQIMRDALTVLWEGNPNLAYDLQRLAKLSKDNPGQYQWLLEMLRKL